MGFRKWDNPLACGPQCVCEHCEAYLSKQEVVKRLEIQIQWAKHPRHAGPTTVAALTERLERILESDVL